MNKDGLRVTDSIDAADMKVSPQRGVSPLAHRHIAELWERRRKNIVDSSTNQSPQSVPWRVFRGQNQ